MYAIAITPLINRLKEDDVKQIWYADDAAAGRKLSDMKTWWDRLVEIGPDYGYYPNASKTWLIVKEHKHSEAVPVFEGTEIVITTDGKRHLGAAIGTRSFIENIQTSNTSPQCFRKHYYSANRSHPCAVTGVLAAGQS